MKIRKGIYLFRAVAFGFCLIALGVSSSRAQQVISYQGVVTQNGTPLSNSHSVRVSIYTAATGGTAIYTETQSLPFTDGIFNDLIGTVTPLPTFASGTSYYVGVSIDGGAELTPRSQLGAAPMVVGGTVSKLNNLSGALTLAGGGGTTINQSGQTITISSSGGGGTGIQGIQNLDGTITITSANGPTATIGLANGAVTTSKIANGAVTTAQIGNGAVTTAQLGNGAVTTANIASGAVTDAVIGSGSATIGKALTADGAGGATWVAPAGLTLPYSQSQSSGSNLFSLTNTGAGSALAGTASAGSGTAAVIGSTTNAAGIGVLGETSDGGAGVGTNSGVCGSSAGGRGVTGNTNTGAGIDGVAFSTGIGVHGELGSGATTAEAGLFENSSPTTAGNVLEAKCMGTGEAGYFHIDNVASTANALQVTTLGTGNALYASCAGTGAPAAIVGEATATGANNSTGVWGKCDETGSAGIGVYGSTAGGGVGVYGNSTSGVGVEAITGGAGNAIYATTAGTGNAIKAVSSSTTSTNPAILGQTASTASGAVGVQGEVTSSSPTLLAAGVKGVNDGSNGNGIGVYASAPSSGMALYANAASGYGIEAVARGSADAIYAEADGTGSAIEGYAFGSGSTGAATGVYAHARSGSTNCNALIANMEGSTASTTGANNCAIFQSAGTNVARIDRNGKGYFDGGTVTGGADVAEEFDVKGARASYSPGDVLVISTTGDRQVQKCSTPYSRLVVGVYATKPGVTLTDMGIDADESARVPMGVMGVIPTKVTSEGGAITAGDLLVTSSTPGCAMKADLDKLKIGEALGKALENYSGHGTGVIKVLVGKY